MKLIKRLPGSIRNLIALATVALAFAVVTPVAQAIPITQTINLGHVYAGDTPDGYAPWLTATFTQTGGNTGTLTLISHLQNGDFLQGLNSTKSTVGWAFFLDQALTSLTFSSGTQADNNALFGGSYNTGPVPGGFNLAFGWSSKNRFDGSDSATYPLTFASALDGNPFAANESGWWSVAHVQGISSECGSSGWIVSDGSDGRTGEHCGGTPPHNVPEPADLGMLGFGVLLIGVFLGLRRRIA